MILNPAISTLIKRASPDVYKIVQEQARMMDVSITDYLTHIITKAADEQDDLVAAYVVRVSNAYEEALRKTVEEVLVSHGIPVPDMEEAKKTFRVTEPPFMWAKHFDKSVLT